MKPISRFTTQAAALVAAVGATVVLASSPASAAGGFWAQTCQDGRACIVLGEGEGDGGPWWNVDGCGDHPIQDYYRQATAHGNLFNVVYVNGKWDRVNPWTTRPLDRFTLVTQVIVLC